MSNPTKKKQKIVLVITRLDRGGSAELTLQLAAGLSGKYYDVLLIYGKTTEPLWEPSKFADNHHFSLQCIDSLIRNLNPFKDLTAFIQLIKIFRQFRPDIVHTNSSKAGILGRLAARICGVRKIYHSPHGHIFYGYYNRIISKIFILFEKLKLDIMCTNKSNEKVYAMDKGKRAFIEKFGKYAVAGAGMAVLMSPTSSSANSYNKCSYSPQSSKHFKRPKHPKLKRFREFVKNRKDQSGRWSRKVQLFLFFWFYILFQSLLCSP